MDKIKRLFRQKDFLKDFEPLVDFPYCAEGRPGRSFTQVLSRLLHTWNNGIKWSLYYDISEDLISPGVQKGTQGGVLPKYFPECLTLEIMETLLQHSQECTCRLRNIAMCDYQESVTTGLTGRKTHIQTPDKVIPMCLYASQATQ